MREKKDKQKFKAGYRYMRCLSCQKWWNVPVNTKRQENNYLCPRCSHKN